MLMDLIKKNKMNMLKMNAMKEDYHSELTTQLKMKDFKNSDL